MSQPLGVVASTASDGASSSGAESAAAEAPATEPGADGFRLIGEHTYRAVLPFPATEPTAPRAAETGPTEVNVGLVVGAERALLIDTGATPAQGRQLVAAASQVTKLPIAVAVITHWHYDHSFGAAGVIAAAAEAGESGASGSAEPMVVLAHESVHERLQSSDAAAIADALGIDPAQLASPSREIAVAAALDLGGGVRVEVVHLGRGHTDGDLVVVVPGSEIIFTGDMFESAGPPQYGQDSYAHEWPASFDGLVGLTNEHSLIVPGHGSPVSRELVLDQRARVAAVSAEISRLAGLGVEVDEAETRSDWALPFAAIRPGYAAAAAQAKPTAPRRPLPLA